MKYSVETISHEFSPKEVYAITGISQALQRDWRRRGIISGAGGGRNAYSLSDLIRMTVLRAFTESGITVETADIIAHMAILPTLYELHRWDDVAVFTGDKISKDQMDQIRERSVGGITGDEQFSFAAMPDEHGVSSTARLRELAKIEQVMAQSNKFYGIVLDHTALAHHIAHMCKLPIVKFHVEVTEAANE